VDRRRRLRALGALLYAAVCALVHAPVCVAGARKVDAPPGLEFVTGAQGIAFVAGSECVECHREQAEAWKGSQHDLAMQEANTESVLGDFSGVRFAGGGQSARFFEKDGGWWVETEGRRYRIAYTFGVHPLQQYLIAFPGGRLQSFPIAWDTRARRWFHLYPEDDLKPGDPLHWTGRYQNWNMMCAECHSTGLRKRYDVEQDLYRTTWAEIDVGCQACHGPGARHVAWARAAGSSPPTDATAAAMGLAFDLRAGGPRTEIETCAPCHSRRQPITPAWEHGAPFLDHYILSTLRPGLYHADGQIQDEVYVYGSFVQSRMYAVGVRCGDCHDPHTARPRAAGDTVCLRCHGESPDPLFAARLEKKRYDTPAHHFHPAESEGARCVSCHMARRTYMQVDPRLDHSLRVPRPDLSQRLGTPNACNDCHADRTPEWAAARVVEWYGPLRRRGADWAEAIAAGQSRAESAAPALLAIAEDSGRPGIVRATALELLAGYPAASERIIGVVARDADPLVRRAAATSLVGLSPEARIGPGAALLSDPVRSVRIEAARVLAAAPPGAFAPGERRRFEAALAEYEAAEEVMGDTPAAHQNLAELRVLRGEREAAEAAYRKALAFDPGFWPAGLGLARLYDGSGRAAEAEAVLRDAIRHAPGEGELHYSLGLLLAAQGRLDLAVQSLSEGVRLRPDEPRIRYNLALAFQHLGRTDQAEASLREAVRLAPSDPDVVRGLLILYAQQARWREALPYASRLVELTPDDPAARSLLRRIEAEVQRAAKDG